MDPSQRTQDPRDLGLDPTRFERALQLLGEWTKGGEPPMPAAALLVGRNERYLAPRFFGRQGPQPDAGPVRADGLFLMASITKPLVYIAAMQLVEQGKLNLSDLVTRHIPEFAANHKENTRVVHLMTHTSGLPDMLPDNDELRKAHAPLERFIKGAIEVAPLFQPGTDFRYQSMGTLVTAELVQRLSGLKIRDYLRQNVLDPLGMTETALGSDGLPAERLVQVQTDSPQPTAWDWNSDYWRRFGAPWGGMFSSPEDFARLCRAMLGIGPTAPGFLGPQTIAQMTTNQLDSLPLSGAAHREHAWGLGWKLNRPSSNGEEFGNLLGPQVFGHTGATGTMVWMDPKSKLYFILLTTGIRSRAPWRLIAISNIVAGSLRD